MTETLQAGSMVMATGYLLGGAALNYFGYRLHHLAVFAVGAVWGIVLGAGGSAAFNSGNVNILAVIVVSVVMGFVALAAQFVAVFLIGALLTAVPAALFGVADPMALAVIGLIGGGIALGLYKLAIVFGTAFAGSVLMTFAILTFIAVSNGETGWSLPNLFSYLVKFVTTVVKSGDPQVAKQLATTHAILFVVIFLSGLAVQLRLIQCAAARGQAEEETRSAALPPTPPFAAGSKPNSPAQIGKANAIELERAKRRAPSRPPAKTTLATDWRLVVFLEGKEHFRQQLSPGALLRLGRDKHMDVALPNDQVSGHHLDIIMDNGRPCLVDQSSTNGTWKKGRTKVATDTPEHGDWYQIGSAVHLKFSRA